MNQHLIKSRKELFIRALRGRAWVYHHIGQYDKTINDCVNAIHFCKNVGYGDRKIIAEIMIDYGSFLPDWKGNYENAEKIIYSAIKKIDKKGMPKTYARCLNALGNIYEKRGNYNKALKYYKQALKIYQKTNDRTRVGDVLNNIGLAYYCRGELTEALKYYKKCLRIYKKIKDRRKIGIIFSNLGSIYFTIGSIDKAVKYLIKDLKICEEIGDKNGIGISSGNIGVIYYRKGKLEEALKHHKRYLEIAEEIGSKRGIGIACIGIAETFIEMNKIDDAEVLLNRAEKVFNEIGYKIFLSTIYTDLAELYVEKQKYKKSLKFAKIALDIAEQTGAKADKIAAQRIMAKALVLSKNRFHEATIYLNESISLARKLKIEFELAKSLYELAKIYLSVREMENVKRETVEKILRYLKEAKKIFKKIGAELWLKKTISLLNQ